MKHSSCSEHQVSRRALLQSAGGTAALATSGMLMGESFIQASHAGTPGSNTVVVLSLRGGIDGLGLVVPHGDPGYFAARPKTALPKSTLLCADTLFGLHPKMAPLAPLFTQGKLAAVQAVGHPQPNRSHFSAMQAIEDAAPGSDLRSGWINRLVGMSPVPDLIDAVQVGVPNPSAAMVGPAPTLAATSFAELSVSALGQGFEAARYKSLARLWSGTPSVLTPAAAAATDVSQRLAPRIGQAANTASYPMDVYAGPFSVPLKEAAKLIKADVGTEVISIDAGNWDFHANYGGPDTGLMQNTVSGLARALAAFFSDTELQQHRVTVITISEFGRRVAENGSYGFDHGWGNVMLVAGAGVRGGSYYGRWPGIGSDVLVDGDLRVTTDYRNVLAEVIGTRLPKKTATGIFPGLNYNPLGIMKAA